MKTSHQASVKRLLNPIMKKYQKIIINKSAFSDKKKILIEQKELNQEIGSFFKKISDESSSSDSDSE